MISNGEGWHYLAVKKLSALLRGITLNSLILLRQKTNVNIIKNVCANKDFCNVVMSYEDNKISEFHQ